MNKKISSVGLVGNQSERMETENNTTPMESMEELECWADEIPTPMESMEGCECWTDAFGERFGERVCVGIEKGYCVNFGKKFKPTKKEIKELWEDYVYQEFGSKEQRMRDLEEEFGKSDGGKSELLKCDCGNTITDYEEICMDCEGMSWEERNTCEEEQ